MLALRLGPELQWLHHHSEVHQVVCELLLQGRLDAALWYDPAQSFPLAAINDAFTQVWERKPPEALVPLHGQRREEHEHTKRGTGRL